jgi:hypothetical protein
MCALRPLGIAALVNTMRPYQRQQVVALFGYCRDASGHSVTTIF